MESSWRLNVALEGMSGTDWRLAASLLGIPFLAVVNGVPGAGTYRLYQENPNPEGMPVLVSSPPIPVDHPHFPYGLEVEPD